MVAEILLNMPPVDLCTGAPSLMLRLTIFHALHILVYLLTHLSPVLLTICFIDMRIVRQRRNPAQCRTRLNQLLTVSGLQIRAPEDLPWSAPLSSSQSVNMVFADTRLCNVSSLHISPLHIASTVT